MKTESRTKAGWSELIPALNQIRIDNVSSTWIFLGELAQTQKWPSVKAIT